MSMFFKFHFSKFIFAKEKIFFPLQLLHVTLILLSSGTWGERSRALQDKSVLLQNEQKSNLSLSLVRKNNSSFLPASLSFSFFLFHFSFDKHKHTQEGETKKVILNEWQQLMQSCDRVRVCAITLFFKSDCVHTILYPGPCAADLIRVNRIRKY